MLILLAGLFLVGYPLDSYQQESGNSTGANTFVYGWCLNNVFGYGRDFECPPDDFFISKEEAVAEAERRGIRNPYSPPKEVTLTIKSNPTNAQVYIDNTYWGATELEVQLVPDSYWVKITKSGYDVFSRRVNLSKDTVIWAPLSKRQEPKADSAPTPTPEPDYQLVSTGTGFVVNKTFVVTADHVLRKNERGDACDALSIVYRKDEYEAQGVDADPANDLGLIKLSEPIESTAKLRGQPDLIQGEMAVNYGFPLMGELSTSAKVTGGSVNSLSGYNNNSSFLQYDAASQHGNSGGPVLDASGNIIGVVSSKLDDAETQLVNFATKSTILEGFLKSNNVAFEKEDLGEELRLSEIAKKAETFTVLVGCWE